MILLSFDIEEFDLPLKRGVDLSFEKQIEYSKEGTRIILEILSKNQVKATFFCTAVFAINARELIAEIIRQGHEVASHGYSHGSFTKEDLIRSKIKLEEIAGQSVNGYRMAYMMKIDIKDIAEAGYIYDSSINPTFIPGRYNNLQLSRSCYLDNGILELPASVSPVVRVPLFWLSMHNFPLCFYIYLCKRALKKDGYLNVYFHSWEFSSHLHDKGLKVPAIVRRNSGNKLRKRLEHIIQLFLSQGESFQSIADFVDKYLDKNGLENDR
jgi:peptidoglycan/xylan/chitin deacetylase (PgdA/CDA1 family)